MSISDTITGNFLLDESIIDLKEAEILAKTNLANEVYPLTINKNRINNPEKTSTSVNSAINTEDEDLNKDLTFDNIHIENENHSLDEFQYANDLNIDPKSPNYYSKVGCLINDPNYYNNNFVDYYNSPKVDLHFNNGINSYYNNYNKEEICGLQDTFRQFNILEQNTYKSISQNRIPNNVEFHSESFNQNSLVSNSISTIFSNINEPQILDFNSSQYSANISNNNNTRKLLFETLIAALKSSNSIKSKLFNHEKIKLDSLNKCVKAMNEMISNNYLSSENAANIQFERNSFTYILAEYFEKLSWLILSTEFNFDYKELFLKMLKKTNEIFINGTCRYKKIFILTYKDYCNTIFLNLKNGLIDYLELKSNCKFSKKLIKEVINSFFSILEDPDYNLVDTAVNFKVALFNKINLKEYLECPKTLQKFLKILKESREYSNNIDNLLENPWKIEINLERSMIKKVFNEIENSKIINKKPFKLSKQNQYNETSTDSTVSILLIKSNGQQISNDSEVFNEIDEVQDELMNNYDSR